MSVKSSLSKHTHAKTNNMLTADSTAQSSMGISDNFVIKNQSVRKEITCYGKSIPGNPISSLSNFLQQTNQKHEMLIRETPTNEQRIANMLDQLAISEKSE